MQIIAFLAFFLAGSLSQVVSDPLQPVMRLLEKGENKKALELLRELLEKDPSDTEALFYAGYASQLRGDHGRARQYYRRLLEADPRNEGAQYWLAVAEDAPKLKSFASNMWRSNLRIAAEKLKQYLDGGGTYAAWQGFNRLSFPQTYLKRFLYPMTALALADLGQHKRAEELADLWMREFPDSPAGATGLRAELAKRRGEDELATELAARYVQEVCVSQKVIDWTPPTVETPRFSTARVLEGPPPNYTSQAVRERVSGKLTFLVKIGVNGRVEDLLLASPGLGRGMDSSAARTVTEEWRFEPARCEGKPVPVWAHLEVEFKIQ